MYVPTTINAAPINVVSFRASPNMKYPAEAAKTSDKYLIGVTRPVSAILRDWVSKIFAYPPAKPNITNKKVSYKDGIIQPLTIVAKPINIDKREK